MSVSPGVLVEDVIAEEPEECLDEEEDCGAGDELCDRSLPTRQKRRNRTQDPRGPSEARPPHGSPSG